MKECEKMEHVVPSKRRGQINHGLELQAKYQYSKMIIAPLPLEVQSAVLAGSIVNDSTIVAIGQEIGPSFDLSSDFDPNTGKTFNHEWESGF